MIFDLPFIWAGLLALAVLIYVILDGFDLGVGILFPWFKPGAQRDVAMNTVAPVWDGNETWLVLGGGGLLAAFPLAFAIIIPAVYAPIIAMLLGLVFRGVAFEFRWRYEHHDRAWDFAFALGSLVATFAQGIILGAIIQGIAVEGRAYDGAWFSWLTPFTMLTGISLVMGYGLLGASWLILKTDGDLRERAYLAAKPLLIATLLAIVAVSLWTPFLHPTIEKRWFAWPNIAFLAPVPIMVGVLGLFALQSLRWRKDGPIFPITLGLFILSYAGLGISIYPYIVPYHLTIRQTAAPDGSLGFLLIGALILLPMILAYNGYAYWVFRGKVREGEGYH